MSSLGRELVNTSIDCGVRQLCRRFGESPASVSRAAQDLDVATSQIVRCAILRHGAWINTTKILVAQDEHTYHRMHASFIRSVMPGGDEMRFDIFKEAKGRHLKGVRLTSVTCGVSRGVES